MSVPPDNHTFGTDEPQAAYMTLAAYYRILKYLGRPAKLPRKLKKRYLGTRSRRRREGQSWRKFERDMRQRGPMQVDVAFEQVELVIYVSPNPNERMPEVIE